MLELGTLTAPELLETSPEKFELKFVEFELVVLLADSFVAVPVLLLFDALFVVAFEPFTAEVFEDVVFEVFDPSPAELSTVVLVAWFRVVSVALPFRVEFSALALLTVELTSV